MLVKKINLINEIGQPCIICITTNGYVKKDGTAVMGAGIAKTFNNYFNGILAKQLAQTANIMNVNFLHQYKQTKIFSFPVKPISCINNGQNIVSHWQNKYKINDIVPGFACKANINIIINSAYRLKEITKQYPYNVYLPKPGCGNGGLKWDFVKKHLEEILKEDKYIICYI